MHFSVFVALFVATFVASCGSFISAETDALDDHPYDNTEVARRLRGDDEDEQEERVVSMNAGVVENGLEVGDDIALAAAKRFEEAKKFESNFKPKDLTKLLKKSDITIEGIMARDPVMMYKMTQRAIKGSKGKEGWFKKTVKYGLMAAGVAGLFYVLYCWGFKAASNTTADSTAKSGKTTAASSANGETTGGA